MSSNMVWKVVKSLYRIGSVNLTLVIIHADLDTSIGESLLKIPYLRLHYELIAQIVVSACPHDEDMIHFLHTNTIVNYLIPSRIF